MIRTRAQAGATFALGTGMAALMFISWSHSRAGETSAGAAAPEEAVTDASPAGGTNDDARVVATVNGEGITIGDIEVRLASMHSGMEDTHRSEFTMDRIVQRMVNDSLIAQEARVLEMDQDPVMRGQVERYRASFVLAVLEREEVTAKSQPTDEEIAREYERLYRRVDLRVVTVDDRAEAEQILERVRGGDDMAELARSLSHDPYAARGGLAAGLPRRDLTPDIAKIAFAMDEGQVGGPIMNDLGWSVIRVEGFQNADPASFDRLKGMVRGLVAFDKANATRHRLAERAAANHEVSMDQEIIDTIRPGRLPDGRLEPTVADRSVIVAKIDDDLVITAGEYADALRLKWTSIRSEEAAAAAAPIILRGLVDEALLRAEARDMGIAERPEVKRAVRDYETQILVKRFLDEVLGPEIVVTPEEIQAYHAKHEKDFPRPPKLRLGQITVATQAEADEIAGLLRGGTDIAWLSKERSTDRFAAKGGDRGWVEANPGGDDFSRQLLEARVGDVLGPIGVEGNFVVLQVLAREEQGTYGWKEVSGNIRNILVSEKSRKTIDGYMTKLRERARITIDENLIASMGVGGSLVEGEPGGSGGGGAHAH